MTTDYSQGTWSDGAVDPVTNIRGTGVFTPTPTPSYSRLPDTNTGVTVENRAKESGANYVGADGNTYDSRGNKISSGQQGSNFDEVATRNAAISAQEARFGAINKLYDTRVSEATKIEQDLGNKDLARANAISAMTGMSGGVDASSSGASVEKQTSDIIKQKQDSINSERAMAISGIYDKIDANVQKEKDLALATAKEDRARGLTEIANAAQSNIMSFATQGVSWEKAYKDPEFQAEVKRSGKSPFELQTAYEKSLPQNMQPKEIFSGWKGDNFVTISQNSDGTTSTKTITASQLGLPKGTDVSLQTIDGAVYMIDKANPYNKDGTPKLMKLGQGSYTSEETDALNWMRTQPDYKKEYEDQFNSDPVTKAKVIAAMKADKPGSSTTVTRPSYGQ